MEIQHDPWDTKGYYWSNNEFHMRYIAVMKRLKRLGTYRNMSIRLSSEHNDLRCTAPALANWFSGKQEMPLRILCRLVKWAKEERPDVDLPPDTVRYLYPFVDEQAL